jgi:hypothetical protein
MSHAVNNTHLEELQEKKDAAIKLWDNAVRAAEYAKVIARDLALSHITDIANSVLKETDEAATTWYTWKNEWSKWKRIRDVHEAQAKAQHVINAFSTYLHDIHKEGTEAFNAINKLEQEIDKLNNESSKHSKSFKKFFDRLNDTNNARINLKNNDINASVEQFKKEIVEKHLAFLEKEFGK